MGNHPGGDGRATASRGKRRRQEKGQGPRGGERQERGRGMCPRLEARPPIQQAPGSARCRGCAAAGKPGAPVVNG